MDLKRCIGTGWKYSVVFTNTTPGSWMKYFYVSAVQTEWENGGHASSK